ncbi:hypothetical protein ECANGB1_1416 [Enterospora canceri]|uniref:Uncharacterized protein n=1 Tax=Enterospora canceri TaxID=1081671 RepID=A0A1Y1S674_9MICR|nr:hypothetical protein ECANGB1_1416 [Enterospora canceri]
MILEHIGFILTRTSAKHSKLLLDRMNALKKESDGSIYDAVHASESKEEPESKNEESTKAEENTKSETEEKSKESDDKSESSKSSKDIVDKHSDIANIKTDFSNESDEIQNIKSQLIADYKSRLLAKSKQNVSSNE